MFLFCEREQSPVEMPCCDMVYNSWNPSQIAEEASCTFPVQIGLVSSQSFVITWTHHPTPEELI